MRFETGTQPEPGEQGIDYIYPIERVGINRRAAATNRDADGADLATREPR
jgi:hypothetical protein